MAGVDIFVGTLTRYYAAAWDTVATRLAKSKGEAFHLFEPRPGTPELNPVVIEPIVVAWRDDLAVKVAPYMTTPLSWVEGMGPDYLSAWLGRGGHNGALLAAAYAQNPAMTRPIDYVEDCSTNPAIIDCLNRRLETPIFNIVNSSLWLPGEFNFGTQTPDPVGQVVQIGSLGLLMRALASLNDLTFRADQAQVAKWVVEGLRHGDGFETQIRFGFATLLTMCRVAMDNHLPMKLHH